MSSKFHTSLKASSLALAIAATGTVLAADPVVAPPAMPLPPPAEQTPGFSQLDTNADGAINRNELGNDTSGLRTRFDSLDANRDGTLSAEEYSASSGFTPFVQLDANADGMISPGEARANAGVNQRFEALDADKDGNVSSEEYSASATVSRSSPTSD